MTSLLETAEIVDWTACSHLSPHRQLVLLLGVGVLLDGNLLLGLLVGEAVRQVVQHHVLTP